MLESIQHLLSEKYVNFGKVSIDKIKIEVPLTWQDVIVGLSSDIELYDLDMSEYNLYKPRG